jgi:hypothetical protein
LVQINKAFGSGRLLTFFDASRQLIMNPTLFSSSIDEEEPVSYYDAVILFPFVVVQRRRQITDQAEQFEVATSTMHFFF